MWPLIHAVSFLHFYCCRASTRKMFDQDKVDSNMALVYRQRASSLTNGS